VSSDIALTVPARSEFVSVLRAVTASVAARLAWPYDAVDDLRLAVDEACAQLLSLPASELTLTISATEDALDVVVATDADPGGWPPPGAEESLAWRVVSALTDEAGFDRSDGGPVVRMRKRTGGKGS
jgi:serine/threonine-protein kinase RsbW